MRGVSRGRWLGTRGDRDARTRPRGGGCGSPGVCTSGPDPARGARPAGGGDTAAHLSRARPAAFRAARHETGASTAFGRAPRGTLTRNPPIYYFWAAPLDHTAAGKIKTAGRRLAVFAKQGLWSRGRVKK